MDFHPQLRKETKFLHDQIEQSPLLKKIIDQKISLEEYRFLIKKFYNFIAPCEALINALPCKPIIAGREKTVLLEEDLRALGVIDHVYSEKSWCSLPQLSEREHVLGYLYVMEGSTLGGQIITQMLQTQLHISVDQGGKFFYGYGKKTKMMWNNFCRDLNNVSDIALQDKIIQSARLTYNTLNEWLNSVVA